jgi:hypothetical protein
MPATHSAHTSRITTDTTSTVGSQHTAATWTNIPSYHTAASRRVNHSHKVRQQPHRRRDAAGENIRTEVEIPATHSVQHDGVTRTLLTTTLATDLRRT